MMKKNGFELITRQLVRMEHLNSHGHLFGGQMFSWIDEAAAMYIAEKARYSNMVTASMDKLCFINPGKLGAQICFWGRITNIGRSSITLEIIASQHDFENDLFLDLTKVNIKFVLLDEFGKPYKHFEKYPDLKNKLLNN